MSGHNGCVYIPFITENGIEYHEYTNTPQKHIRMENMLDIVGIKVDSVHISKNGIKVNNHILSGVCDVNVSEVYMPGDNITYPAMTHSLFGTTLNEIIIRSEERGEYELILTFSNGFREYIIHATFNEKPKYEKAN